MILVYNLFPSNHHEIFSTRKNYFDKKDLVITKNWIKAHVITSCTIDRIKAFIDRHSTAKNKVFLVYTHEPRWDTNHGKFVTYKKRRIHIMNCYTGDVYATPFGYFSNNYKQPPKFRDNKLKKEKYHHKIVIFASAHKALHGTVREDLTKLRYNVPLEIKRKYSSAIDIFGAGWPPGTYIRNTRMASNSINEKMGLLKNYYFNICFENTNVKNYISEKLWQSVSGGCLPIYWGNPWVYKIFPKNSFIDYRNFKNPIALLNFIKKMPWEEFIRRYELCKNAILKIPNEIRVMDKRIKIQALMKRLTPLIRNLKI